MDLPIDQLRTFVTVVEYGSFTQAAETLHRTQPALSLQMKRLEEQVGTSLLARSGRQTTVTEAGALLLDYARRILDLNEQALGKLSGVETEGTVRIGILEEVALGPLVELLTKFGHLCSKIQLELVVSTSDDLAQQISTDTLCLAVANEACAQGAVTPLWIEPYVWACGPDFDMPDSASLPLVMDPLTTACEVRDVALRRLDETRRSWHIAFSSGSLAAVQAAVRAGLGVGLMAQSAVLPEMRVLGPADGFPVAPAAHIGLYRGSKAVSEASDLLANFLQEHLQQTALPLVK